MRSKSLFERFLISLGVITVTFIIYSFYVLTTDLNNVLFMGTAGFIVGVGYVLIILFHLFVLIELYLPSKRKFLITKKGFILFFFSISTLFLFIQKVMYDEVAREIAIESVPGEINFIYLGLIINLAFILFVLKFLIRNFQYEKNEPIMNN